MSQREIVNSPGTPKLLPGLDLAVPQKMKQPRSTKKMPIKTYSNRLEPAEDAVIWRFWICVSSVT